MTTCNNEEPPARSDTTINSNVHLLKLPSELLIDIMDLLPRASLNSLARTCKPISSLFNPRLYRQHERLASHWAAENGKTDTARRVIKYSKDPKDLIRSILLPTIIVKGHKNHGDLAKFVISEGANLNLLDDNGLALRAAAQYGHVNIVRLLISHGADINQKTSDGMTALAMAITNKKPDVVMFLVQQKGIDLGYETNGGIDVLQWAIKHGYYDVVGQLLQCETYRDAHINTPFRDGLRLLATGQFGGGDFEGPTLLFTAAQYVHDDILELLISHGADINQKTSDGRTALAVALKRKRARAILLLVQQKGIDLGYETNGCIDVLQWAIKHGYYAIVDQLLQCETYRDAHINTPFLVSGLTPLVTAEQCGFANIAKLLISHGADQQQGRQQCGVISMS